MFVVSQNKILMMTMSLETKSSCVDVKNEIEKQRSFHVSGELYSTSFAASLVTQIFLGYGLDNNDR